ncbi:phosphoribosylanthranilate isomerase [Desulfobulbus rhabdoformis]|jgi:phosphoribosylanthranilate isomerase|uniref:phosphoribosylanthranilate isomerase n=1 Tax=Desulfobulbus rhabdoformis TaxID=34032 RepID=UPI0019624EF9|nr:phosphoribosylanthranilate isomerase [Desulfobulbus rhabdoformis]MBM9616775.1 phosphoribosylanthranilate isomerase [Desulfobulbus rhabdoformis]
MSGKRVRVKICGTTRLSDALCAVDAGVDALGFIFFAKSPRNIEPDSAKAIIAQLPPFVDTVGVFVNEAKEKLQEIVEHCGLNTVQLHGQESPDYCRSLALALPSCRLLKAFRVGPQTTAADIAPYAGCVQGYLLDTFQKDAVGGTGKAFDWALIERLQLSRPLLLAGGLDCDNVGTALRNVAPYGLDANSGLEDAPGVKNHTKIQTFLRLVRESERS